MREKARSSGFLLENQHDCAILVEAIFSFFLDILLSCIIWLGTHPLSNLLKNQSLP